MREVPQLNLLSKVQYTSSSRFDPGETSEVGLAPMGLQRIAALEAHDEDHKSEHRENDAVANEHGFMSFR